MAIDAASKRGRRVLERLATDRIAWFTSVTPAGQPQTLPVWFLWENDEVLIYSATNAVRNRNVAANPHVSFHLADDGEGNDLVILEGEARIDERTPPATEHHAYLARYDDWLASYGWTAEYFSSQYSVPIRLRPTKVRGV